MLERGEEGANSLRGAGGKVFRLGRGGGGGGGRGTWTGDKGWSGKSTGRLGQGSRCRLGVKAGMWRLQVGWVLQELRSHSGGILVGESASPYQERWSDGRRGNFSHVTEHEHESKIKYSK